MRFAALIILLFVSVFSVQSQDDNDSIIFVRDNTIYAQPTNGGAVIQIGAYRQTFEEQLLTYDAYSLDAAPIADKQDDTLGFHHGVWSSDRTRFAYIELSPPRYRVNVLLSDSKESTVLENEISSEMGYLDPVGWTEAGQLLLLKRMALTHLHRVDLFVLDVEGGMLDPVASALPGHLVGRTALLSDGLTLFLGFDFTHNLGILLDTTTGQIQNFPIDLTSILPPQKGFEYFPLSVYGAVNRESLIALAQSIATSPTAHFEMPQPEPFLHWALAENHRYITCYTDSEWTAVSFETSCPGLAGRNYEGHQGTDISAEPDGLPIGTPVYPSAIGTVVASYRDCLGQNPSCNHSYGNTILLEHVLIVDGETQVWYTGYGHLQMVIANDEMFITDLTQPIALSGATGIGGAHLHFEVRTPQGWVDPWDDRTGDSLWVGGNEHPQALVTQDNLDAVPKVLDVCMGYAGNNIRSGAGTGYNTIGKTRERGTYYVTNVAYVGDGDAVGDWYEVFFSGGRGWLWSGVLSCP